MEVSGQVSRAGSFNPRGNTPKYSLDRRLGGPQNRSGLCGEDKKSCAPVGNQTPIVKPVGILS
jgi:hypothetical protein